jgi:hypothetical protein
MARGIDTFRSLARQNAAGFVGFQFRLCQTENHTSALPKSVLIKEKLVLRETLQ